MIAADVDVEQARRRAGFMARIDRSLLSAAVELVAAIPAGFDTEMTAFLADPEIPETAKEKVADAILAAAADVAKVCDRLSLTFAGREPFKAHQRALAEAEAAKALKKAAEIAARESEHRARGEYLSEIVARAERIGFTLCPLDLTAQVKPERASNYRRRAHAEARHDAIRATRFDPNTPHPDDEAPLVDPTAGIFELSTGDRSNPVLPPATGPAAVAFPAVLRAGVTRWRVFTGSLIEVVAWLEQAERIGGTRG